MLVQLIFFRVTFDAIQNSLIHIIKDAQRRLTIELMKLFAGRIRTLNDLMVQAKLSPYLSGRMDLLLPFANSL